MQADVAGQAIQPGSHPTRLHENDARRKSAWLAKHSSDAEQIKRVRGHLRDIQHQFLAGDLAGPAHIHGQKMPDPAELKSAPKGKLRIDFREVPTGAELNYRTSDPAHHDADAMAGQHHHPDASTKQ
jgi:hypothetical protein